MLGSRVATIRDLLALVEPSWSPPSRSGGAPVPAEGSLFAAGHVPRRRPRPRRPVLQKRKHTGAPSSTATGGVPSCNPETSVGLMVAVAEPASARLLRVAEPARAGASGIVAALAADLNRNSTSGDTASYSGGRRRVRGRRDEPSAARARDGGSRERGRLPAGWARNEEAPAARPVCAGRSCALVLSRGQRW